MGDLIRKVYPFEVKAVGERVLQFIGSTEDVDRDGEVILASGWDLKNYKANPVFMWAHRYSDPPIGKANRVWAKDGRLNFQIEFADADTYEFADTIFKLYKGGFLKATSVGFVPMEWEDGDGNKTPRRTYKKQELLELSAVPVPANPTALITEEQAGEEGIDMGVLVKAFEEAVITEELITPYAIDPILKPEETENFIRIPIKGEEGKHDGHKIKTIDIDKQKGITALYCGDCKKVTTYLFDKEKGWTMATAQQWVRDHARGVNLSVVFTHATTMGDAVWENGELAWTENLANWVGGATMEDGKYIPLVLDPDPSSAGTLHTRWRSVDAISQKELFDEMDYLSTQIPVAGISEDGVGIAWDLVEVLMRELRGTGGDIPDNIMADFCEAIEAEQDDADDQPVLAAIDRQELAKLIAGGVRAEIDRLKGVVR